MREIYVLLVGDQCADVERLLHQTRWGVRRADSVAEARATLKRVPVHVVLCQHTLRDGTWSNLLNAAQECDPPAAVVVLSEPDDRTWAEVLSTGAYDLFLPCTAAGLYAIVPMAWRHCMQQESYARITSESLLPRTVSRPIFNNACGSADPMGKSAPKPF